MSDKGKILETSNCLLTNNFHEFLESEEFADVVLKVGETDSIRAHKMILIARSPVFASMLKREMQEKQNSEIVIEDISAPTLKLLLKFLYSGGVEGIDLGYDEAFALYYAADKYDIFMVREFCAKVLVSTLSKENAFDVMALADRHLDEPLKSKVIEYMYGNCRIGGNELQEDVKNATTQHSNEAYANNTMFPGQTFRDSSQSMVNIETPDGIGLGYVDPSFELCPMPRGRWGIRKKQSRGASRYSFFRPSTKKSA